MAEASSPKTPEKTVEDATVDLTLAPRKMKHGPCLATSSTNFWIMLSVSFVYPIIGIAVTTLTRPTGRSGRVLWTVMKDQQ